jgi:hypothetical protein
MILNRIIKISYALNYYALFVAKRILEEKWKYLFENVSI